MADNLYDYLNRFTLGNIGRQLKNIEPRLSPEQMKAASAARLFPYESTQGFIPGRVGSIPPSADGKSYRRAELELAEAARAGGGGGGGGNAGYSTAPFVPAAERDYQNEKSRVAQLTEQDQLLKKYKVADLAKAYNAAKGDERERLGMEIFALTNPGLAKKVKPGQTGYETIQATRQANTPFGSALSAIPSSSTTNYQSAFTAMPADKIVSQAFGGVSGEGVQSILNTTPDLSKAVAGFPAGEKPLGGMSIKDAFTSSVFNPSQDNLSAMQLALLKEAFNKRLK